MTQDWKATTVLVTGAGGFIGSHLTEELVRRGASVRAFSHYNALNDWGWLEALDKEILDNVEVFRGDIRDLESVTAAMKGREVVFHLSSLVGIPYSYQAPDSYLQTNTGGALNIVMAARQTGVRRIVETSTSEVYGTALYVPIDEKHPLQPQSPYSASKIAADMFAISYYLSFGVPVAVARPFNTYGPRQSARAVIPTIIGQLLETPPRLQLGVLSAVRDFNYVADTVAGFLAVARCDQALGEAVNLGSGRGVSVGEVAEILMRIIGVQVEIVTDEARMRPEKSEVLRLLCDNRRAREWMGWEPRVSIDEGLARTVEWFVANRHRYKAKLFNV